MSELQQFDIDDIVVDITSDSYNKGHRFGTIGRFPIVEDISGSSETKCETEGCPARRKEFKYYIDRVVGEPRTYHSYDDCVFDWDENLDEFTVRGHYCPICSSLEVSVDGQIIEKEEGNI